MDFRGIRESVHSFVPAHKIMHKLLGIPSIADIAHDDGLINHSRSIAQSANRPEILSTAQEHL